MMAVVFPVRTEWVVSYSVHRACGTHTHTVVVDGYREINSG